MNERGSRDQTDQSKESSWPSIWHNCRGDYFFPNGSLTEPMTWEPSAFPEITVTTGQTASLLPLSVPLIWKWKCLRIFHSVCHPCMAALTSPGSRKQDGERVWQKDVFPYDGQRKPVWGICDELQKQGEPPCRDLNGGGCSREDTMCRGWWGIAWSVQGA